MQKQSLARTLDWVAAVAVSGPEEGSADDVVRVGRCAGQQRHFRRLVFVSEQRSWTAQVKLQENRLDSG